MASNLVYGCRWTVTIEKGPPNSKGRYEAYGIENGKTTYRNIATGAMLQFDSDRNRWILVCDDNQGLVDSKHVYWSSDNADRDVPWSESDEMSGTSWRLDNGTESESKFKVKGMSASVFCVTWPPKTFISTLVRQRATPCELRSPYVP